MVVTILLVDYKLIKVHYIWSDKVLIRDLTFYFIFEEGVGQTSALSVSNKNEEIGMSEHT